MKSQNLTDIGYFIQIKFYCLRLIFLMLKSKSCMFALKSLIFFWSFLISRRVHCSSFPSSQTILNRPLLFVLIVSKLQLGTTIARDILDYSAPNFFLEHGLGVLYSICTGWMINVTIPLPPSVLFSK